jgi:prepilin-type N-terminal cleavage/methylation domain-containing protein
MNADTPCQPSPARRRPSASETAPGFTLIELLVVVSIIALLIGILIPVLGIARVKAQDSVCLANQHSLAQAWQAYVADHGLFPNHSTPRKPYSDPPLAGGWGGSSPVLQSVNGNAATARARPLNEYLGLNERARERVEVFRCPRDNGAIYPREQVGLRELNAIYDQDTGLDESMFFIYGNSYYANDWVWARVGAVDGMGVGGYYDRRWQHYNKPDQVLVYPASTMMLADGGAAYSISLTDEQMLFNNIATGWWHGKGSTTMAMWDGSARGVSRQIGGAGPEFNRWLIPEKHAPEGTPTARFPYVRNPDLAHSNDAR